MRGLRFFSILLVLFMGSMGLSWVVVVQAEPSPATVTEAMVQGQKPTNAIAPIAPPPSMPSAVPEGITLYLNRDLFINTYPALPFEDFGDSSSIGCEDLTAILAPLNTQSNNSCFSPGDIQPGVEFRDNPINGDDGSNTEGLIFVPTGAAGVTNQSVTGNNFTNTFEILLTPTARVVGLDMVTLFGEDNLRIRLFNGDDQLIYSSTLPVVGPSGFFLGFEVQDPIGRIELLAAEGAASIGSEGLSGIFFGSPGDEITLELTVGTNPHSCATTDNITVLPNTEVTYCYRLTNNTPLTLTTHTLTDTVFGVLLEQDEYELGPGASFVLTESDTPTDNDSNSATWTVLAPLNYTMQAGNCGLFPDITATGEALDLEDDDYADISLPLSFRFYDLFTDKIWVSNNGIIFAQEIEDELPTYKNVPFPDDTWRRVIGGFWDDLGDLSGNVYVGPYTFDVHAHGANSLLAPFGAEHGGVTYFAVEWFDRNHYDGPEGDGATFTTLLAYPNQGMDGYMVTCYQDTDFGDPLLDFGASATIGINQSGTTGDLYSFNSSQLELTGSYGIGYTTFNAGSYVATDTATVVVFDPDLNVTPLSLAETHATAPQTTVLTMTLTNTGDDLLVWQLYESFNQCAAQQSVSWLTPDITQGSLPRGREVTVSNTFNSAGLPNGTYSAHLCIMVEGTPDAITVPVSLTVQNSSEPPFTRLYLPIVRRR